MHAEPWHLSYAPRANQALNDFPEEALQHALKAHPVALQTTLLTQLPVLLKNYIYNIDLHAITS